MRATIIHICKENKHKCFNHKSHTRIHCSFHLFLFSNGTHLFNAIFAQNANGICVVAAIVQIASTRIILLLFREHRSERCVRQWLQIIT